MLGIDQFPEHMQSCFWNADAYIVIIMQKQPSISFNLPTCLTQSNIEEIEHETKGQRVKAKWSLARGGGPATLDPSSKLWPVGESLQHHL